MPRVGALPHNRGRLDSQRQTLLVQNTIALTQHLRHHQVPDSIREFLLEVWAEVLAVAESYHGADSKALKAVQAAGEELADIAGTRREHDRRQRQAARFPDLLPVLAQGMELLGMNSVDVDDRLQDIQHGMLGPVFRCPEPDGNMANPRTDAWSAAVLVFSRREPLVDCFRLHSHRQLNDASLRTLTCSDQMHLHVVSGGGLPPDTLNTGIAHNLQVGDRFWRILHPRAVVPVQLQWQGSDRQLVLLCDEFRTGHLYHPLRLAHHLQAGLLMKEPTE